MKKFRLDGVVGVDFTAAYVAKQLDGAGDVEITLNTKGGHINEGMAIYNAFLDHEGFVTMIAEQAMSMGSVILQSADRRVGRRESTVVMIHRPNAQGAGRSDDFRAGADELDRLQLKMQDVYMLKYAGSTSDLEKKLEAETYLDADEAMALGLLDEVISGSKGSLYQMAFAALAGDCSSFDRDKFSAKIRQIEAKGGDFCASLQKSDKLSDIESSIRQRFGASRTEATAIVSAVKRVQGDLVGGSAEDSAVKALEFVKNFKL